MATVSDVAKRAGVSVSTASRVLSGRGYAAPETRRLVLDTARELGFVPNRIARSLRTQETHMIGLLIGDVENPFYSAIASNVESVTRASGYNVVLCNSDDDAAIEREFLTLLQSMRVDGLIVTPTLKNRKHLRGMLDRGIVIVQIDRKVEGLEADAILIDNQGGARTAVEHIIAAGHSRIGMLSGDPDVSTAQERLAGFRKALADHGIAVDEDLIKPGSFHREHAIEDAIELVTATPAPTAILAANNLLAEAALIGIAESGLKVPDDISLVGFDSVPWMRVTNPPLTAVRQPVADMAHSAAELLLRRLRGEGEKTPNTVVFQADLVERASVAHLTPTKAVPH